MFYVGIVRPAEPAAGVYENENDVDDQNAQDGMLKPIDSPKQTPDDADEKSYPFFTADEPESREDKGRSYPIHAITPLLLYFAVPSCLRRRGCLLDSQSSGGSWGGAWAVGVGPTGEPARNLQLSIVIILYKC